MPATMQTTPTSTASVAAVVTRSSGSAPATGTIAARTSGATAESGASTRIREGPTSA